MREIIQIQVGQCGNQIGNAFWNTISPEHKLKNGIFEGDSKEKDNESTLTKINVYFEETKTQQFIPRACFIDLEPGTMDVIKSSPLAPLYKPNNFCFGQCSAGNNWAKGHYSNGAEIIDQVMDIIRHETEICDSPQGFQLTHSIGGGTGAGLGTLILLKLFDAYVSKELATYSVSYAQCYPPIVDPYNATLCIHQLLENSFETFVFDNIALFNIAYKVLKQKEPTYSDLNWVIAMAMSGITASFRFPVELNSDLKRLGINLVPFPRLHFFLLSHSPLFQQDKGANITKDVKELTNEMWSDEYFLSNIHSEDGKYLSASCSYRGNVLPQPIEEEITNIHETLKDEFIEYIPHHIQYRSTKRITNAYLKQINIKGIIPYEIMDLCRYFYHQHRFVETRANFMTLKSIISVPPTNVSTSATLIANTTAMKSLFQRISRQFAKIYTRKAFLHWYKEEGMDEMEFQEADKNLRDLITEYQDKQDAVVDDTSEYDSDYDTEYDEDTDSECDEDTDEDF